MKKESKTPLLTVIIPTWNGEDLLRKNLPKVLRVLPKEAEVVVVENGSEDGSALFLKKLAKKDLRLKLILNKTNLGFIKGCNQAAKLSRGEFLVLINNDVVPKRGFLKTALVHFKDEKVFAVSFQEVESKWGSWARIFWSLGYFNYLPGEESKTWHITGWASGGSAVFRKSMWDQLGGFDELYEPFYWEDLDLSYRAWKNGWKVIWEPKSKVKHKHASTISRFDKWYVAMVRERNQLLFIWKNISNPLLCFTHFLGMVLRVLSGPNYLKVIISARKRFKAFNLEKPTSGVRSDIEIFSLFKK